MIELLALLVAASSLEELISGRESLSKPPIRRNNVEKCKCFSINQSELKREILPPKVNAALPICTPVPVHGHPRSHSRALYPCTFYVATPSHVRNHHHVEIPFSPQRKTDSSSSFACYPLVFIYSYVITN